MELSNELQVMYKKPTRVIPIIIGTLGTVTKKFKKNLLRIGLQDYDGKNIINIVLKESLSILSEY